MGMRNFSFGWIMFGVFGLLVTLNASAAPMLLADVNVLEPGEYRAFDVGQAVGYGPTGPTAYWNSFPSVLASNSMQFYYLAYDSAKALGSDYGRIDFQVSTGGPVWMFTGQNYGGGGNSSGNWIPELSSPAQLQAAGWHLVNITPNVVAEWGYGAPGTNTNFYAVDLWERQSLAGETFSIRTEKYGAPVIMNGTAPIPEPGTVVVTGMAATMLIAARRRVGREVLPPRSDAGC
jgi:hypothetical protein